MAGLLHDSLMQCLQLLHRYHGECKGYHHLLTVPVLVSSPRSL